MRSRWMAGTAPHKSGDVDTNPDPTTTLKNVWICVISVICHIQIHVRMQISIKCNMIEHLVHLRCVGIRRSQYSYTLTFHIHKETRLTTHTVITTLYLPRPWTKSYHPRPRHHPHNRNPNTRPTLPLFLQDW